MTDLDAFCGSPFWDINLVWNTTNPDFPECFQKTVLVWIPCGFLWLFATLEIHLCYKSTAKPLPWTGLNITRMILSLLLAGLALADMSHWLILYTENYNVPYVNYNTPFIKALTYLLALIILFIMKKKGRKDSGVLFIFWLLTSISETVMFRTNMMKIYELDSETNMYDFIINVIMWPMILVELVLSSFADEIPEIRMTSDEKEPCPQENAGFVSRLTFSYFFSLALKGYRKPLTESELWELNSENKCNNVVSNFTKYWEEEKSNHLRSDLTFDTTYNAKYRRVSITDKKNKKQHQASILSALWQCFRWTFLYAAFLRLTSDLLALTSPLILQLLIEYISSDQPEWRGYFYCALIFVSSVFKTVLYWKQFVLMSEIGMRARSAVVSAIYQKALRISCLVKQSSSNGDVNNLISVDAQKIMDLLPYINNAWSPVIQIVLALYLLWLQLGPSILTGLGAMVIMVPVNGFIYGKLLKVQTKTMGNKDIRVKIINEALNGIKVLKLYAWEQSFFDKISEVRSKELKWVKTGAYILATAAFVIYTLPYAVSLITFATYVLSDEKNILNATKAFVSISLFNMIRFPLFEIPMMLASISQAYVSFKRINQFLNAEELDPEAVSHNSSAEDPIIVKNGVFAWGPDEEPVLHNIDFNISEGQLVAVVGSVGSGKSSLISAVLGEMERRDGFVNSKGSLAYVAQQAWIRNATVRENIIIGHPYEEGLYQKVISACALGQDLEILPGGDQTEIGEKGINLSGGQKQRVSLARAVYSNADVILLDDPLSAVDVHVGKHIFENVIGPNGLLKKKTRMFVTNGVNYLPKVDKIIVLNEGHITEIGSYQELLKNNGPFAEFLLTYLKEQENSELVDEQDLEEIAQDIILKLGNSEVARQLSRTLSHKSHSSDVDEENMSKNYYSRQESQESKTIVQRQLSKVKSVEKIIQEETVETGTVATDVYMQYLRAVGVRMGVLCISLFFLSTAFAVGSNVWLSAWSQDQPLADDSQDIPKRNLRLGIFAVFGLGQGISVLGACFAAAVASVAASSVLHGKLLYNILRCPMSFFDTTPLGRIVNRFSKDIDTVDTPLPMTARAAINTFFEVLASIVVISAVTPIFIAVVPFVIIIYLFLQKVFIATSRQLQRLESITRSPIFSHFSESLNGLSTIRAYGYSTSFIAENHSKIDRNQICYYPSIMANSWLAIRIESVGSLVIFLASLFAVLSRNSMNPGVVGLSITYALAITNGLNWLIRLISNVQVFIVSVERIKEYCEVQQEASWEIESWKPESTWPQEGLITFKNYSTRYRDGLDLILRGVSCSIAGGEKVGIVGRTGAGKSSLTLGLFRIIEPATGTIIIDGVDISNIGLHDLRSKLTIIPQDPVLFCGTMRQNLDPFNSYSDMQLWNALEHSHLKQFVTSLPMGLQHEVAEGGENLSVGQRQLVCLARALLRKTKVLILDEATAAVDVETDELVQTTIREEFRECTIITIAHRINTILDSTRIIVLDQGLIKEFDSPRKLLEKDTSIFYGMVKEAGLL